MDLDIVIVAAAALAVVGGVGARRMAHRRVYGRMLALVLLAFLSGYISWSSLEIKLSPVAADRGWLRPETSLVVIERLRK